MKSTPKGVCKEPETIRLQTCAAWKEHDPAASLRKEAQCGVNAPGSRIPSRNTGQGVDCHGEPKGWKPGGEAKAILRNLARGKGGGPKGPSSHGGLD
jgi:hypothetical protein